MTESTDPLPIGTTAREGELPLLAARGLVMDFTGVRALDHVDFELHAGQVHALMGENGAGKSTLVKVLTGIHASNAGEIRLNGREIRPRSPRDAEAAGITTVYQEVDLIPTLSVAENVCLGRQPIRFGLIRHGAARRRAESALARLGLRLDVSQLLGECSIAIQQLIAISRALDIEARVLILDEPTSSLDAGEAQRLFSVLRRLRGSGIGIIFVSHFLDDVYEISDRVTVLRNGARVGTWPTRELSRTSLVEAMTGRRIGQLTAIADRSAAPRSDEPAALSFRDLGSARSIAPTSAEVRRGEALGLAGLLGSGRSELARLLFGADRPDSGDVQVGGKSLKHGSIRDAISHGVALTPEDRKSLGLVLDHSVRENVTLAMQARRGSLRPIPAAQQRSLAEHYIRVLGIKTPSAETPVGSLSGGNQQKVLLARWLAMQPGVLILDEPTRGIDVGARAEIEALVARLREQGTAIVFISSELDELVRACNRVLVLRDRRAIGELAGDKVDEARILSMIAEQPATEHN